MKHNKKLNKVKKQLVFAPSSLILANYYLACYLGVRFNVGLKPWKRYEKRENKQHMVACIPNIQICRKEKV
jgi:hypothetical protein